MAADHSGGGAREEPVDLMWGRGRYHGKQNVVEVEGVGGEGRGMRGGSSTATFASIGDGRLDGEKGDGLGKKRGEDWGSAREREVEGKKPPQAFISSTVTTEIIDMGFFSDISSFLGFISCASNRPLVYFAHFYNFRV